MNAKKTQKSLAEILKETFKFNTRHNAFAFAARAEKTMWVMLGDDGKFWVTTPANCSRLERMGYDWAN